MPDEKSFSFARKKKSFTFEDKETLTPRLFQFVLIITDVINPNTVKWLEEDIERINHNRREIYASVC